MTHAIASDNPGTRNGGDRTRELRWALAVAWEAVPSPFGLIGVSFSRDGVLEVQFLHAAEDLRQDPRFNKLSAPRKPWQSRALHLLQRYLMGKRQPLDEIPIDYSGLSEFRRQVMEQCRAVPFGQTVTYQQLAGRIGYPKAARAVGGVMRTNPLPLIVPCHRIVRCDGTLGGYSGPGGVNLKRRLLELEGAFSTSDISSVGG